MKKSVSILIIIILAGLYFFSAEVTTTENVHKRIHEKQAPYNYLLAMRTFPDESYDHQQFKKVLKTEQQNLTNFKASNKFDEPWTTQGPGNIGGRISTIAVHPENEDIILIGYAFGGIFKTINGGQNWYPVFDNEASLSLSDIAFDPTNPEIIWAGTGDNSIPYSAHIGDGIYKSTDGGESWENSGLNEMGIVSKVVVHPENSSVIYAACMGVPMVRNENRGVYKSEDGGLNWNQILFIDDQTGALDIYINPANPDQLYASGFARIRTNTESFMGAESNHIYKTNDGGETWSNITEGQVPVFSTKVIFTVDEQNADRLFAIFLNDSFNAEGYFQSIDGGESWAYFDLYFTYSSFGWYFDKLQINPDNNEEFYRLGVNMYLVGSIYESFIGYNSGNWISNYHPDTHDIHFLSDGSYLLATDGGLYKKYPDIETFEKIENNAVTQFYRVAYNPRQSNSYQGGAQDNNCAKGNAESLNDWFRFSVGDGFQLYYHPSEEYYFTEYQRGNIIMNSGVEEDASNLDFLSVTDYTNGLNANWNTPYTFSKEDPLVMFTGGESIFKVDWNPSTFFGTKEVTEISPRLTNELLEDVPSTTRSVTSLDLSYVNESIIYAGTGDGRAWRTLDNADNWERIDEGLPERFITSIKASPDTENTVYVTHSGYRSNEYIPHVHRSVNNGTAWEDISANLPQAGINDIYILPNHADSVLFVGTDIGVYASINAGESWERLGNNMPFVPAMDLEFNPEERTLFVGTFARSILSYPIDSLVGVEPVIVDNSCEQLVNQIYISLTENQLCEGDELVLVFDNNNELPQATLAVKIEENDYTFDLSAISNNEINITSPEIESCSENFSLNYEVYCGSDSTFVLTNNIDFEIYKPIEAEIIVQEDCYIELQTNCENLNVEWGIDINDDGSSDYFGLGLIPNLPANEAGLVGFSVYGNTALSCQEAQLLLSPFNCVPSNNSISSKTYFRIYPNILNGESPVINIENEQTNNFVLKLFHINGKEVFSEIISSTNTSVNFNHLQAGMYILFIEDGTSTFEQKLIVH